MSQPFSLDSQGSLGCYGKSKYSQPLDQKREWIETMDKKVNKNEPLWRWKKKLQIETFSAASSLSTSLSLLLPLVDTDARGAAEQDDAQVAQSLMQSFPFILPSRALIKGQASITPSLSHLQQSTSQFSIPLPKLYPIAVTSSRRVPPGDPPLASHSLT